MKKWSVFLVFSVLPYLISLPALFIFSPPNSFLTLGDALFFIGLLVNIYVLYSASKIKIRLGVLVFNWLYFPLLFLLFCGWAFSKMFLTDVSWQSLEIPEANLGFYLKRLDGPPDTSYFLYIRKGLLPHLRMIGGSQCDGAIQGPFWKDGHYVYFDKCTSLEKYDVESGVLYPKNDKPITIENIP